MVLKISSVEGRTAALAAREPGEVLDTGRVIVIPLAEGESWNAPDGTSTRSTCETAVSDPLSGIEGAGTRLTVTGVPSFNTPLGIVTPLPSGKLIVPPVDPTT
jgi:hypothetical protein